VLGFCQARQLSTEGLSLSQHVDFDAETHLPTKVTLTVNLPEGFPEKYRAAIVRTAEQCKVKKSIAAPPEVTVAAA
jgi:ribosomal protein S12 methylthiotransferase accessory factor